MRVLVTGAGNPVGEAIVHALLADGHAIRIFGMEDLRDRFSGEGTLEWFPGDVAQSGSIEPPLSERQVLVHAACLDELKDKRARATHIEAGTLWTRYAAEREQVDHFIHVRPAGVGRWVAVQDRAEATARGARGIMNIAVVQAEEPAQAAAAVQRALAENPLWGKPPSRNDAVTA